MKKAVVIILLILIIPLSGCSGLKVTPQMQEGIDAYLAAINAAASRTSGKVVVDMLIDDQAVEFQKKEDVIVFDYRVEDGKVIFSRTESQDGVLLASYECDGETVRRLSSGEETDVTEGFESYLSAATNPLVTLSLFRVDSKNRIRTDMLENIEYTGGSTVKFTLKNSAVDTVLGYTKAKGIVRKSGSQSYTYTISEGMVTAIVVDSEQVFYSNGKEGNYKITINVTIG